MRRDLQILVGTALIGAAVAWGGRLPDALENLEIFRVREVEVRGVRYLDREEVLRLLDLRPTASVWGDTHAWAERVLAHPLVESVEIARRVPDKLVVRVTERTPIALAPTPTLEPVDAEGHRLPLDPAEYRLDLPIIHAPRTPPEGSRLFPSDVRRLAAELEHLMAADTAFIQRISSVSWTEGGALRAQWSDPPVEFLIPPHTPPARLREGLGALRDALERDPGQVPDAIDLRFADQVVIRTTQE